ncbi:MAG: cytochrome c3 family protein [Polyangiales bacterium]
MRILTARRACGLALLLSSSCANERAVTVVLPAGVALDPQAWSVQASTVRADRNGHLTLGGARSVAHPSLCPIELAQEVRARARLHVTGSTSQVGYDAPITLRAELGCPENATLSWRQLEGLPLAAWRARGATLEARTLPLQSYFPGELPVGLVPISPRTQGRYVIEVTLEEPGKTTLRERVVITSIARATGMTSLATEQTVLLGAKGWQLASKPRGSEVHIESGVLESFRADRVGSYKLTREGSEPLELRVLTHERTPMDCGRAECHASEAQWTAQSPMSHALARATGGTLDLARADACMFGCHTTGEPGIDDGGFSRLLEEHGFAPQGPVALEDLPRPLQRLAGVRCTACHGPGAIPTEQGRASILRADVCATCHDAPPRYTQVGDWKRSAMARADADERTRAGECAGCHTTGGFLDRIGVRKRGDLSRDPDGLHIGLTCAVCHAPHGPSTNRLLRVVEDQPVCASCHELGLVKGRLPELEHASAHRELSCTSCHGANDSGKLDHSFQVAAETCSKCHEAGIMETTRTAAMQLARDAEALRHELGCGTPTHASACASSLLGLVADDRGAAWHNLSFARELLRREQLRSSRGSGRR